MITLIFCNVRLMLFSTSPFCVNSGGREENDEELAAESWAENEDAAGVKNLNSGGRFGVFIGTSSALEDPALP